MNTVSFQNKGLIDPAAITTFGVSVKENSNPIGFFGTGIKYAIAILLRNECSITIHAGKTVYEFDTIAKDIRGQSFDIVRMNGVELGFTLELGKTWKMWQAFRELYCNTLDEQGETFGNAIPLQDNCTTVIVTGARFYEEYVKKDQMMLLNKPQYQLGAVELHDKPGYAIHFQGVRVGNFQFPSMMTYNLLSNIKLTEDRTIKSMSQVDTAIRIAILACEDKALLKRFITAPEKTYEGTVDLNWYEMPGEAFMQVVRETPFKNITNSSIRDLYKKHHRAEAKVPEPVLKLTEVEQEQLKRAIEFSELLDFDVTEFKIHVTDDVQDNVLGMAYGGEIYLARRVFMQGTKMVAATLIEEFLHLNKGFQDNTYAMQNFLFEKIVTLGEEILGEPL